MAMLHVTAAATRAMTDFFRNKAPGPVRISLQLGGCGIRFFGVAEAVAKAGDARFDIDGFTYLIDRQLLEQFGPIEVNSDGFAFRLSGGGIHPPSGCGTCAFGCNLRGKSRCSGDCQTCASPCRTGRRNLARKRFADCMQ